MWHQEKDTLNLLGQYTKKYKPKNESNNDEKIVYRDFGKFNSKYQKENQNNIISYLTYGIGFVFVIFIIKSLLLSSTHNPIIGKWISIDRNSPIQHIIEFTEEKIIRHGMSMKVNYEIYKDKVEIKPVIGFIESDIGEVYYIRDKNTIIENGIFGQRILKKIQ